MSIRLKRAYEPPDKDDGSRVLVDRLWPRGITKERLQMHTWLKNASPSNELRKSTRHDPEHWEDFKLAYFRELDEQPEAVEQLLNWAREGALTLLYAAKNEERNNAAALKEYLENKLAQSS